MGLAAVVADRHGTTIKKTIRKNTDKASCVLNTVGFSSTLLDIVKTVDPENQTSRFDALLKDYKGVVKLDGDELKVIIERSTEQVSNLMEFPKEWRAEMRAKLSIACGKQIDNVPTGGDEFTTESPLESTGGGDTNILLSSINDVTNMMVVYSNLSDIFVAILESIYRGLGLNRVVLLINNADKKELVVRFGFAPDLDESRGSMKVSTEAADPIAKALNDKTDLLVDNVSATSIATELPIGTTVYWEPNASARIQSLSIRR